MYFLKVKELLTRREVENVIELSKKLKFVDGSSTNPGSRVKKNLQGDVQDPVYMEAGQIIQRAIFRNKQAKDYALPKNSAMPVLSKYEPGMEYGYHVDACILATKPPIRADVSMTVFLNDPGSYEGGELSAKAGNAEFDFKLDPGDAVFYPSVTLHRVKPVTKGQRLVAITFIESHVRNHYHRQLLYELASVIGREAFRMNWETLTELTNVHTNLYRLWCDK